MKELDELDLSILHELQLDGRLSNQELADRVGLSPSPCLRRVRALEVAGVIAGYRAIVSEAEVGLALTAFVRITVNRHDADTVAQVESQIRAIPEVVEAHLLTGDADYQLKIVIDSFQSYEKLLKNQLRKLESVGSISTTFAVATTKHLAPLQIPE